MTGGVLMSKNNLLLGFILGLLATFFLLSAGKAQDRIPACPPLGKTLKMIKINLKKKVLTCLKNQPNFPNKKKRF